MLIFKFVHECICKNYREPFKPSLVLNSSLVVEGMAIYIRCSNIVGKLELRPRLEGGTVALFTHCETDWLLAVSFVRIFSSLVIREI